MLEQIRRICALHELGLLSERGLIMALDYHARHSATPAKRR